MSLAWEGIFAQFIQVFNRGQKFVWTQTPVLLCRIHNWISAHIGSDGGQLFDCGNVFSAAHDAKSYKQNTMFKKEDILV